MQPSEGETYDVEVCYNIGKLICVVKLHFYSYTKELIEGHSIASIRYI